MHLLGLAWAEDHGGCPSIAVQVSSVRCSFSPADDGVYARHGPEAATERLDDGAPHGDFRRFGEVAHKRDLGRMILEPRIVGRPVVHELDELVFDGCRIFTGDYRHASFQQTAVRKGTVV